MSAKEELIKRLSERLGECVEPKQMIDELFRLGALDTVLARHAIIRDDFEHRMASTRLSRSQVTFQLCDEHRFSETGIRYILRKGG